MGIGVGIHFRSRIAKTSNNSDCRTNNWKSWNDDYDKSINQRSRKNEFLGEIPFTITRLPRWPKNKLQCSPFSSSFRSFPSIPLFRWRTSNSLPFIFRLFIPFWKQLNWSYLFVSPHPLFPFTVSSHHFDSTLEMCPTLTGISAVLDRLS